MTTRFDLRRDLVLVRARFRGPAGELTRVLALDTGAARTLIDRTTLEAVGYDIGSAGSPIALATVSRYEEVRVITVDEVMALGRRVAPLAVVVHDLPAQIGFYGLLGLDFLRGGRLSIDFLRGEIDLTSP